MMHKWIEWYASANNGKFEGPLPAHALVTVMHLDGERDTSPAGEMNWGVLDVSGEIIAYKQIGWVLDMPVTFTELRVGPSVEAILKAHLAQRKQNAGRSNG